MLFGHAEKKNTFALNMANQPTSSSKKSATKTTRKKTGSGKEKPVILITNDDGVTAPGIMNLVEAVKDLGKVVVVAPDKPQSGMGHAITIGQPLRLHKVNIVWRYRSLLLHRHAG